MVDLGLARPYRDLETGELVPYAENCPLSGTLRYASIGAHLGIVNI